MSAREKRALTSIAVLLGGFAAVIALVIGTRTVHSRAAGAVAGKVTVFKKGKVKSSHAGIVITIEGVPDSRPKRGKATVEQRGKQFQPALTVVPRGSTVSFPNQDKIAHNVFSVSRTARFDLGLYKSGESKSVKLRRAGVIDVYCNIHPEMVSKIKVVDTRFYAVTGRDGRFRIGDIPPGTYPIRAWQAYGSEYKGTVKVTAGGTARVSIKMKEGRKPRRHLRKDGTPYGRYK